MQVLTELKLFKIQLQIFRSLRNLLLNLQNSFTDFLRKGTHPSTVSTETSFKAVIKEELIISVVSKRWLSETGNERKPAEAGIFSGLTHGCYVVHHKKLMDAQIGVVESNHYRGGASR